METAPDIPPVISDWQRVALMPVAASERIATLDVLRGLALFGILTVNIGSFSWPIEYMLWQREFWNSRADAVVDWMIRFLAEGKFYPVFSFLFGLGAAIQMERADCRGAPFAGRYCRRMFGLLGFGLVHALLIWDGDILVWYALCGFLLLLFRKRRPKTVLIWALACLVIPALLIVLFWALLAGASLVPELGAAIHKAIEQHYGSYQEQRDAIETVIRVFATGSYVEIFRERLGNVIYMWLLGIFFLPEFLGLFLLGLYAGKRRLFQDIERNVPLFRRVLVWGMIIGLPLNLFHVVSMAGGNLSDRHFLWLLSYGLAAIGGPVQGLAYVAALTLLLRHACWQQWLRAVGTTGKMALSNYLLQSVICTTIFYSYGFGLFGSVGRATGFLLVALIYVVQVGFSAWWLSCFQFGPMEWLWRTFTYGKRPVMRRGGGETR
jgi:uncharacterized protein